MEVLRPRSLDEALDALATHPTATLLAGGTDLMVRANYQGLRPEVVVALRRVPELQEMSGGFIGAGVTWARLTSAPWPGLAQAARTVGSPQIRAMGTLGGNLGTASPAGDGLPFLAAVDARIEVASRAGGTSSPGLGRVPGGAQAQLPAARRVDPRGAPPRPPCPSARSSPRWGRATPW